MEESSKGKFTLRKFYNSNLWTRFREHYIAERLARDGILKDDITGQSLKGDVDTILHHKIFLTEDNVNDFNISLNPDNIMLVSHETHQKIHNKFNCNGRKIFITLNENLQGFADIVISWKRLFKAVGENEKAISNTYQIYDLLIDNIRTGYGKWTTALIIAKDTLEKKRLIKMLGAEDLEE